MKPDQIMRYGDIATDLYVDGQSFRSMAEAVALAARADVLAEIESLLLDERFEIIGHNQSLPGVYLLRDNDNEPTFAYHLADLIDAHGKDTE